MAIHRTGDRVNFADPVNLVPLAAGIIAGIGNLTIKFTSTFSITGIAAGTLIVIIGYHGVRVFRRGGMRDEPAAAGRAYEGGTMFAAGNIETPRGELLPYSEDETVRDRPGHMSDANRPDAGSGTDGRAGPEGQGRDEGGNQQQ